MVVLSHPTGNQNCRQAAMALEEAGLLAEIWTGIVWKPGGLLDSVLPGRLRFELARRSFPKALSRSLHTRAAREFGRLACQRLGLSGLVQHEDAFFSIDSVFRDLDRHVAGSVLPRVRSKAAYAYEDGALETFRSAGALGIQRLYDLPIGYWRAARRILSEEAARRPDWLPTMPGLKDSDAKLARKDEELRLADRILVASTFTKSTLEECPFPLAPVSVIPYGADDAVGGEQISALPAAGSPLRVLFVGGLSQRKGIADLFEAVAMLGAHVKLTVIGRRAATDCLPLNGGLARHRWIESLPREEILQEMRAHDVFVFPSLFEGFGLVVTEALSQGLPVITTPHTCGPDVLTEGEDGFIVPIRDPQAIAEKLELLHRDRDLLAAMSEAARKKAESLTWESYRRGVVAVVREVLGEDTKF